MKEKNKVKSKKWDVSTFWSGSEKASHELTGEHNGKFYVAFEVEALSKEFDTKEEADEFRKKMNPRFENLFK